MTKVEFFDVIINGGEITAEVIDKAKAMKATAEKRSSKPTKTQVANEGIKAEIAEVLNGAEAPMTAKAIADAVGQSTNKVAALLKQIDGVTKTEGKGKASATYSIG